MSEMSKEKAYQGVCGEASKWWRLERRTAGAKDSHTFYTERTKHKYFLALIYLVVAENLYCAFKVLDERQKQCDQSCVTPQGAESWRWEMWPPPVRGATQIREECDKVVISSCS